MKQAAKTSYRPFVALYKCHRGGEWFRTSLEGIKDTVDGIVVVFGSPWLPTDIPENCSVPLELFKQQNPHIPIHTVHTDSPLQDDQYSLGMKTIIKHFGRNTTAMIVDTDEIWLRDDAAALRSMTEQYTSISYFRVAMQTYIKRPDYRINPPEPNKPTVAVRCNRPYNVSCRFSRRVPRAVTLPGRFMHHYSYVRQSFDDIRLKFYATESQEAVKSNETWLSDIWPRLPDAKNFHMAKGYEGCWQSVQVINRQDIPPCVLDIPFVQEMLAGSM